MGSEKVLLENFSWHPGKVLDFFVSKRVVTLINSKYFKSYILICFTSVNFLNTSVPLANHLRLFGHMSMDYTSILCAVMHSLPCNWIWPVTSTICLECFKLPDTGLLPVTKKTLFGWHSYASRRPTSATEPSVQLDLESGTICQFRQQDLSCLNSGWRRFYVGSVTKVWCDPLPFYGANTLSYLNLYLTWINTMHKDLGKLAVAGGETITVPLWRKDENHLRLNVT